jgi:cytoskeletal protein CcmA (bactofilin family)
VNPEPANACGKRDIRTGEIPAHSQDPTLTKSTINEALVITGSLTSRGNLHVNGRVDGTIHCHSLVLGENSCVEGDVVAEEVVIHGRLIGSVHALGIVLCSGCYVEGDLYHESLVIEQGVHFEGPSSRARQPSSAGKSDTTAGEDIR